MGVGHPQKPQRGSQVCASATPLVSCSLSRFIARKSNVDVYEHTHIINGEDSLIYKSANQY